MDIINSAGEHPTEVLKFIEEWDNELPYFLAHTSGSTGIPKEIRLLKQDAMVSAQMTCGYLGIRSGGVMACVLAPSYIAGKMMIVRAALTESTLWVEDPSNRPLENYVLKDNIDLLAVVPSQLHYLLSTNRLERVNHLLIGGSALPLLLENELVNIGADAYVTYGMTETCSHVALRRVGNEFYSALPGVSFSVDGRGCLIIDCPHLSIKRVITNDIVDLQSSYQFRWIGRYDNVINSGGLKIHPEEIENRISTIVPGLVFYLVSKPSRLWGEALVMVVEGNCDVENLYLQLSAHLDHKFLPKEIVHVCKLPRTHTNKVKREKVDLLTDIIRIFTP